METLTLKNFGWFLELYNVWQGWMPKICKEASICDTGEKTAYIITKQSSCRPKTFSFLFSYKKNCHPENPEKCCSYSKLKKS